MTLTSKQKKWAWGLTIAGAIITTAYFTKDHWMPLFKKKDVAPTTKPMADITKEKDAKSGADGSSNLDNTPR